jgi:3-hydroxy-9,10-secoandrosta-1,3,5(10)-triene-9,17-dione monooxygenase
MTTATQHADPDISEVITNVRALVPMLRDNAAKAERARQVPPENIEALTGAGVFRLTTPRFVGGLEAPVAVQNQVTAEIARGCPSTSWVVTISLAFAWMASVLPDEAMQEIITSPDVHGAGVIAPTGKGRREDGGVRFSGRWAFNTGARNATWASLTVMVTDDDGSQAPHLVFVPYSELTVHDDWHATGLSGTGSHTTSADDVFVPGHRVVPAAAMLTGQHGGNSVTRDNPYYTRPSVLILLAGGCGTPQGIAQGALDVFLDRLPGRSITYTGYTDQAQAPITHTQLGEAMLTMTSLDAHVQHASALADEACSRELSILERASIRAHAGYSAKLSRDAVSILYQASGASAIQSSVPIQRYHRDIHALALHGFMQPTSSTELLGRVRLGLPPDTNML